MCQSGSDLYDVMWLDGPWYGLFVSQGCLEDLSDYIASDSDEVALVLRTVDAFRTFDLVNVMTAGGPALSTEVMSLYIYRVGFKFFQMGRGAAAGQIMLLGAGVILAVYFRFLYRELE